MARVVGWLIHLLELIVSLCNLHTQVDAEEFFQLFFSDEGIGFTKNFHTRCGDDGMLKFCSFRNWVAFASSTVGVSSTFIFRCSGWYCLLQIWLVMSTLCC